MQVNRAASRSLLQRARAAANTSCA